MRVLPAIAVCALLAGCGSSGREPRKDDDSAGARVVRTWADAVRAGRFSDANATFALPVTVANGFTPVKLHSRAEVDAFNRSFPCGAILQNTRPAAKGRFVATFKLSERKGPGSACGKGVGKPAQVAFLVRGGHIVEWVRVNAAPAPGGELT